MNTTLTIDETLKFFRAGWMTQTEAVDALMKVAPMRFQRQRQNAADFLFCNTMVSL